MMIVPVLLVLTVLGSVTSLVCDTPLARDSYACCNVEKNKHHNCSFYHMQDKCSPGENWDKQQKSCLQFTFHELNDGIREKMGFIWCGGKSKTDRKEADRPSNGENKNISAYDKNGFFWYCPSYAGESQPAALQEATVLLDPSPGNITETIYGESSSTMYLTVKLTGSFPKAMARLFYQDGTTLKSSRQKGGTDFNHTSATSADYEIDLRNKETSFTVEVYQPGFQNKTFHYRVTTVDHNTVNGQNDIRGQDISSGQNTIGDNFSLIFFIFYYYVMAI